MRVKRGNVSREKKKKVLKRAKGYKGAGKKLFKAAANIRVIKAGVKAYRDRKKKKYAFKHLWMDRIKAGLEPHNISYSRFIDMLNKANVKVDRKIMAELVISDINAFNKIVEKVKA